MMKYTLNNTIVTPQELLDYANDIIGKVFTDVYHARIELEILGYTINEVLL